MTWPWSNNLCLQDPGLSHGLDMIVSLQNHYLRSWVIGPTQQPVICTCTTLFSEGKCTVCNAVQAWMCMCAAYIYIWWRKKMFHSLLRVFLTTSIRWFNVPFQTLWCQLQMLSSLEERFHQFWICDLQSVLNHATLIVTNLPKFSHISNYICELPQV